MADEAQLTGFERFALKVGEFANEDPRGKWLQNRFLRGFSYIWVRAGIANRCLWDGLDQIMALRPQTGVLLASNHRSFFDQYIMLLGCFMGPVHWAKNLYFPVRANFFYESPLGMFVNGFFAAGAMYPPVYREKERRALNDQALDKMVEILKHPGNVLGMHPEGTRGKGDDPYQLLPAQPGVGKLALVAKPVVIPAFIHGLGNNIAQDIQRNYSKGARKEHAVICVFGDPMDFTDLQQEKPRPTLYKKCADRMMAEVKRLSEKEKLIRADVMSGKIDDADPRWLSNRGASKFYAREGKLE